MTDDEIIKQSIYIRMDKAERHKRNVLDEIIFDLKQIILCLEHNRDLDGYRLCESDIGSYLESLTRRVNNMMEAAFEKDLKGSSNFTECELCGEDRS